MQRNEHRTLPINYILLNDGLNRGRNYHSYNENQNMMNIVWIIIFIVFIIIILNYFFNQNKERTIFNGAIFRKRRNPVDDENFLKMKTFCADDCDTIKFMFDDECIKLKYNSDNSCGNDLDSESFSLNKKDKIININSEFIEDLIDGMKLKIKNRKKIYCIIVSNKEEVDDDNSFHYNYIDA